MNRTLWSEEKMHVAIRELALLVAVAAGSAEAFAPAPTALSLRGAFNPGASPQQRQGRAVAAAPRSGVLGLAALQNADKIGRIVPRTWKEGTDYAKAAKVLPDRRLSSPQPPPAPPLQPRCPAWWVCHEQPLTAVCTVRAWQLAPGDLVFILRSDGTRRYGEVLKSTGMRVRVRVRVRVCVCVCVFCVCGEGLIQCMRPCGF